MIELFLGILLVLSLICYLGVGFIEVNGIAELKIKSGGPRLTGYIFLYKLFSIMLVISVILLCMSILNLTFKLDTFELSKYYLLWSTLILTLLSQLLYTAIRLKK